MDKELEVVRKLQHCGVEEYRVALEKVEKILLEYEQIKESNPSEALECLEIVDEYVDKDYDYCQRGDYDKDYNTIKQALLKSQEQEKENAELKRVLEVLFKKQVDLGWLWYCVHECINSLDEYNKKMPIEKFKLTQEEFDLLKRWSEK